MKFSQPVVSTASALACVLFVLGWAACGGSSNLSPSDAAKFADDSSRVGKDLVEFYEASRFDEATFAKDWNVFSGKWRVTKDGRLSGEMSWQDMPTSGGAPLGAPVAVCWFNQKLPREFEVSWKARATKHSADLNAYFCGNGQTPSGYEVVFGGDRDREQKSWFQQIEPADQFETRDYLDKIKPDTIDKNRVYDFRIVRTRDGIEIFRDGEQVMDDDEDAKLLDEDARHFAFVTWDNEVEFWDFRVESKVP
jgi:hypothetical protein